MGGIGNERFASGHPALRNRWGGGEDQAGENTSLDVGCRKYGVYSMDCISFLSILCCLCGPVTLFFLPSSPPSLLSFLGRRPDGDHRGGAAARGRAGEWEKVGEEMGEDARATLSRRCHGMVLLTPETMVVQM